MQITVAICTWNRCELLQLTLEHMTKLQVPPRLEWELLVVDNHCTDATSAVISSFVGRLPIRRLWEPQPGLSHARNRAAREARGDYILWTDDDVLVEKNWLIALVEGFEQYAADWLFGRAVPVWPKAAPPWFSSRFNGYFALLDYGPQPTVVVNRGTPFFGVNVACRRDALARLGPYRVDYGTNRGRGGVGEDTDMFERALAAGQRIVYVPRASVGHVIPATRATRQFQRRKVWVAGEDYYRFLRETALQAPWLLGLPRYFYRATFDHVVGYVRSLWAGDRSDAFYHELQLIRFVALSYQAWRHGIGIAARPAPAID